MVTQNGLEDLVKKARSSAIERKYKQSFELILSLKDIDTKKHPLNINEVVFLPTPTTKRSKVCVVASGDLGLRAGRAEADRVLPPNELDTIAGNKREAKKLARSFDFFLAETSAMTKIGRGLGRFLGPRGRMPTPVPLNAPIENLIARYRTGTRVRGRNQMAVAAKVGDEDQSNEEVAENAMAVLTAVLNKLPNGEKNLKGIAFKLSMSPPARALASQVK